jgi:thiol-disulfide isomerase/thioredoxin
MSKTLRLLAAAAVALLSNSNAGSAAPNVEQALTLKPVQSDVNYDTPTRKEAKKCKIESSRGSSAGWIVRAESGQTLRRFLDTNKDQKLDQWSYFRNGIEVYRDVDGDFNGKADQYRWLGTGGTRWGMDVDENGDVDRWKMISPEEATAEVVVALRTKDAGRFKRLLLTAAELQTLALGRGLEKDLKERLAAASSGIASLLTKQTMVASSSKWLHFGATRPGIIPAGTDGSKKDLLAYDNATAIIDNDGKHGQVSVGTLIRVGDAWRVVDLPKRDASAGFFYASIESLPDVIDSASGSVNEVMQSLLADLEKVDDQLATTNSATAIARLNKSRADVLEKVVQQAADPKERANWTRQFADSISAAVQAGDYPDGLKRLKSMHNDLRGDPSQAALVPYIKFHYLTADYGQKLQKPNADFAKIQAQWIKDLKVFTRLYPKSESTPDAMLQLAMAHEFAGKDSDAAKWYGKVVNDFSSTPVAKKAAGAKRRLESVGRSISLSGTTTDGKRVNLDGYRGKVVLVHYWATWCEPCKEDLKTIKALQAKYAGRGFAPLGINLDNESQALKSFLRTTSLSWPQLHESGGLESRLANELGILTLPTMLLIDKSGRVVRRNIHSAELKTEIERLLKESR